MRVYLSITRTCECRIRFLQAESNGIEFQSGKRRV